MWSKLVVIHNTYIFTTLGEKVFLSVYDIIYVETIYMLLNNIYIYMVYA